MEFIFVALGLLSKVVLSLKGKFYASDFFKIIASAFVASVAFKLLLVQDPTPDNWLGFLFFFATCLALLFFEKILLSVSVNEGVLLVYCLAAIILWFGKYYTPDNPFNLIFVSLSLLTFTALLLCLSERRFGLEDRRLLYMSYIVLSSWLVYETTLIFLLFESSLFAHFLLGFYGLHFFASVTSLCFTGLGLENKYSDTDMPRSLVLAIIVLFFIILIINWLTNDWFTGMLVLLIGGSYIATSRKVLVLK